MLTADSFGARLSAALDGSPYTLSRLSQKLTAAGTPVAPSTLSQWRSGHTAPTRKAALQAVATLETLLDVPNGYLTHAAKGRARRTEGWWNQPSGFDTWDVDDDLRARLRTDFGDAPHAPMRCRVRHDTLLIDELGRLTSTRCTHVLQVEDPRTYRFIVGSQSVYRDQHGTVLHNAQVIHGGDIGRMQVYRDRDLTVFEILLARQHAPGDVVVVEYELFPERLAERTAPEAEGWHIVQGSSPFGRLVIEARFPDDRVPLRAWATVDDPMDATAPAVRHDVELQGNAALLHVSDMAHGQARLDWRWY